MMETARTRTGAALGFGALAGCFALAAPAHAIPITTITTSNVSAPAGPFYSVFDSSISTNPKFTFSGTSDGDTTDTVDIRCYIGGTDYNTVVAGVPVNADGTFSSVPTDLGNVYDSNCRFRAIQSGANPTDLSPFTGPWAGVSESDISTISGGPNDGTKYDFFADIWQRSGHAEYDSVSDCGIARMEVMSPLSRQSSGTAWICSAGLRGSDPNANAPGRSEIEIDGRQAYGSAAAQGLFTGPPASADNTGFPALTSNVAQDGATGNGTINEAESFVACPDGPGNYPATSSNCTSFIGTGVKLERTISQTDDGRTVTVADAFSSTDSAAHQLRLHYDNTVPGEPRWNWPGQEPSGFSDGDVVTGPFTAPDSLTGRVASLFPSSTVNPGFALTWDTAPVRARYYNGGCSGCASPSFLLDYDVSVPAGGTKVLQFVYQANPSEDGVIAASTRVRDALAAPTVTITTPANGATVNTATVNVGGKALDNVGVASLVVNGTSVTPAADGTYSVPVNLVVGVNTLTATVKDAAGNSATATETVTYKPAPAPAPKCVVPSVKRGSTVSSAKKLLVKAHCRAGKTRKKHSSKVKKGRVISLAHKAGTTYPGGTKIAIVVSSGKKK